MLFLPDSAKGAIRHIEDVNPEENRYSPYDGIDVSSYQQEIDWEAVSHDRNVKFVYIKATEGATYTSPHFESNIKNARQHGIKVGSYHFLRSTSSIQAQFDNFRKSARKDEQDIVPLIDIENKGEWSRKELIDSLQLFANLLRDYYGSEPMIYTSSSFYNNYLCPFFSNNLLFIAKYSSSEPELKMGVKYALWQYSDNGRVDGISGRVDLCKFNDGVTVKHIMMRGKRSHSVIDDVNLVEPNMNFRMQTPSKFKSRFDQKLQKEKEKKEKEEQKKREKEEKKAKKDKDKKKMREQVNQDDDTLKYPTKKINNAKGKK